MGSVRAGALALVVLGLAATGCSGGSDKASKAATTTTRAGFAATSCRAFKLPPVGATDTTTAAGDFDGDGQADKLSTFRIASAGTWHVRVELANGGADEVELPAAAEGVKALGGYRLDAGSAEAAVAVVGASSAGANIGFFVVRSCHLERVTLGGQPAEFAVRTGASARSGVACQPAGLVTYSASTTDGQAYQASTVSYLLLGNLFDEVHRAMAAVGATDPALAPYGSFSCGALKL